MVVHREALQVIKKVVRSFNYFVSELRAGHLDINIPTFLLKSAYYHLLSKNIFSDHTATILGIRNIETRGRLSVGVEGVGGTGWINRHDRTFVNVQGRLVIEGIVGVGKGCRICIHKGAVCTIRQCAITGLTNIIITHGLEVGKGSTIAWGCEILDADGHAINYEGKQEKDNAIVIGDHVWIGSNVKIKKGVHIADDSVVASNSVVTKSFTEKNVLIAGHPAKIVKRGVEWH
jgi:acetyltransferase-like isoleucine patch superfamily enzyme